MIWSGYKVVITPTFGMGEELNNNCGSWCYCTVGYKMNIGDRTEKGKKNIG